MVKVPICRAAEISIHAPPRGATFPVSESPGVGKISIHAPPRGATFVAFRQRLPCKFQFTPLREGRPAARATVSITTNAFQFTPLREGRPSTCSPTRKSSYFNSRPSARGDFGSIWSTIGEYISIHAPPRGATTVLLTPSCFAISFQFTPLREGRPCAGKCFAPAGAFQFTPLREGRLQNGRRRTGQSDFNSRPSARGDSTGSASDVQTYTFQFTPLREGRHRQAGYPTACRRFQFTPLREGRRACRFLVFCGFPFQFTPLREGRRPG